MEAALSAPRHARAVLHVVMIAAVRAALAISVSLSGSAAQTALASMQRLGHAALAALAVQNATAANVQALARLCNFVSPHKQTSFRTLFKVEKM